jgi:hypothetical protein
MRAFLVAVEPNERYSFRDRDVGATFGTRSAAYVEFADGILHNTAGTTSAEVDFRCWLGRLSLDIDVNVRLMDV